VNTLQEAIETRITEATGETFRMSTSSGMGGGCIHSASRIDGADGRHFFVKENTLGLLPSFEAEAYALGVMAATGTIRVPAPLGTCKAGNRCALILEYLPMQGTAKGDFHSMGAQLAAMHRHTSNTHGWPHDNWIGSTPQINQPKADWVEFYRECRLEPQVKWARQKHLPLKEADALLEQLPDFFHGYEPKASLLHGDLWAGNAGFLDNGIPLIFDPAAYYGDRETDLAMTEMFGGYSPEFYEGYNAAWPMHPGYPTRKQLYILYHTLNHYNLFGGGYGSQAEDTIRHLLRSLS
jgi:fructosamine-3-kinase